MAEEKWILDTPDGFKIHGVTNKRPGNDKVVIYVHGLGGSQYDYAAIRMAYTLPAKGYDIIRINLYWYGDKTRSLIDCTFKIHGADINTVAQHFRKEYKKLFIAGHSYGGPSIMESNTSLSDAISLWDPTFIPAQSIQRNEFKKYNNLYLDLTGHTMIRSKDFIDAAKNYTRDYAVELAQGCKTPMQVIYAGENPYWLPIGESFHSHVQALKDEKIVKNGGHAFIEKGATATLLRYTRQWFDKF